MLFEHTSIMQESMYIQIQNKSSMSSSNPKASLDAKIHRINQRKEKYKRSTNNSHKKFICVARKLLYKLCTYRERELFEKEFEPYQNSRVYYFIILSHVKIRMAASERENFKKNLTSLLQGKVHTYNQEIRRTNNKNFINFRFEEIADIEFALKALTLYLENQVEEAIEVIYKKEKGFVLKKQQFQMALSIVGELQDRLQSYPQGELFPYLNQKPKRLEIVKEKTENARGRHKKDEDQEWVQEKTYRETSKCSARKQKRKQLAHQQKNLNQTTPLLFLENSYSINPHFYSILFSYPDPQSQNYLPAAYQLPTYYNSDTNYFQAFSPESNLSNHEVYELKHAKRDAEIKIKSEESPSKQLFYYPLNYETFGSEANKKTLLPPRQTRDTMKRDDENIDYIRLI